MSLQTGGWWTKIFPWFAWFFVILGGPWFLRKYRWAMKTISAHAGDGISTKKLVPDPLFKLDLPILLRGYDYESPDLLKRIKQIKLMHVELFVTFCRQLYQSCFAFFLSIKILNLTSWCFFKVLGSHSKGYLWYFTISLEENEP